MSPGTLWDDLARGLRETAVDLAAPWRRQGAQTAAMDASGVSHLIACQQFRAQLKEFPANAWAACIGVLLWTAVLWHLDPEMGGLLWAVVALGYMTLMPVYLHHFRRAQPSDAELLPWAARCGRMNQMMNLIWGSVGFMLPPEMAGIAPYVCLALLLVITGELPLYAIYRPSIAWVVPCAALAVVYLVWQGGLLNLVMGAGMLLATALLMRLARVRNALMTQSMVLAEERVALLAEVQRERAAAQQANEAKTRFLAMVSHDLRQPVHSIALLTGVLDHGPAKTNDLAVGQIADSVATMGEMLDALLESSGPSSMHQDVSPADLWAGQHAG